MASFCDCCLSKKDTITSIKKSTLFEHGSSTDISFSCNQGGGIRQITTILQEVITLVISWS